MSGWRKCGWYFETLGFPLLVNFLISSRGVALGPPDPTVLVDSVEDTEAYLPKIMITITMVPRQQARSRKA